MTNDELIDTVEWSGWYYLLTEVESEEVSDVAVREALADFQEAFRTLVRILPDIDIAVFEDTSSFELDFG